MGEVPCLGLRFCIVDEVMKEVFKVLSEQMNRMSVMQQTLTFSAQFLTEKQLMKNEVDFCFGISPSWS